jgi:hypothetical protein
MTDTTHVVECLDDYSFRYLLIFIFGVPSICVSLSIHFERKKEMNERERLLYIFTHGCYLHSCSTDIYFYIYVIFFLSRPKFVDGHLLLFAGPPYSLTGDQLGVRALIVVVQGVSELFTTA